VALLSNTTPCFFSDYSYYKNTHFQRCLRNWNKYIESTIDDEEELTEWEEVLLKDFLQYSEWLTRNKDQIFYKVGLE